MACFLWNHLLGVSQSQAVAAAAVASSPPPPSLPPPPPHSCHRHHNSQNELTISHFFQFLLMPVTSTAWPLTLPVSPLPCRANVEPRHCEKLVAVADSRWFHLPKHLYALHFMIALPWSDIYRLVGCQSRSPSSGQGLACAQGGPIRHSLIVNLMLICAVVLAGRTTVAWIPVPWITVLPKACRSSFFFGCCSVFLQYSSFLFP